MNNRTKIEFEIFQDTLKTKGIDFYLDMDLRHDGERLENYVFEKNGKQIKVIEKLVRRETGQSHVFVPTGSKKKGEDFTLVPLTDNEFYKQWLFLITNLLKNV